MNRTQIPALTGLRIFAAVAVYFSHVGVPPGSPKVIERIAASGYCGVTLFFVLSGFVLTISYFDGLATPSPGKLWRYGVARLGRVYPTYLVVLGFVVLRTGSANGVVLHVFALQAWSPPSTRPMPTTDRHGRYRLSSFSTRCFPFSSCASPVSAKEAQSFS